MGHLSCINPSVSTSYRYFHHHFRPTENIWTLWLNKPTKGVNIPLSWDFDSLFVHFIFVSLMINIHEPLLSWGKSYTANIATSHIWWLNLVLSTKVHTRTTCRRACWQVYREITNLSVSKKSSKSFKIIHSESLTGRSEINVWSRKPLFPLNWLNEATMHQPPQKTEHS